nr:rhomboid family intramembrane serine protease [Allomuricauda sp.]
MASGGLKYYFARLSVAEKLIAINLVIFVIDQLAIRLGQISMSDWFQLPRDFFEFVQQPWSLVTYSFFHADLWHVLFNMLILYFAGRIFLNLFDDQRFLNAYFMAVILGGLVFLGSYNLLPGLVGSTTPGLIGASAGVTGVLLFVCSYIPNQEVRLFMFNIKLWYIGAALVLKDLLLIPYGENVGGRLAHLGGALLGYVYARQLLNGNDIGAGFAKLWKAASQLFKPREKKGPLKTVYKNKESKGKGKAAYDKAANQKRIDDILDKISKSGYESLSKAEKDFLFKAGKED